MYGYTSYGLPTFRRIAGGTVQDFEYGFDPLTGNLLRRRDNNHSSSWEEFSYDSLDRLISAGGQEVTYALNGNLVGRGTDETMTYGTGDHSYQVTGYSALITPTSLTRSQSISYTSYGRPLEITESNRLQSTSKTASFTYGAGGDRIRMVVTNSADTLLTRYYIGERYERDKAARETVKRLYLGGDAYSAPMVLCKVSGSWKVYQIGRDYLGSITQIIDEDGEVIEENSYDPWGRRRDVSTHTVYAPDAGPDLFLGRGYTGHEHLPWFGLVNMNARLYDPLVGRFLSPDPYVQAPDFTQNFNRYSYALNNPLKYSDESGEFIGTILTALLRFPIAIVEGIIAPAFESFKDKEKAVNSFVQAWDNYGQRVSNAFKIDMGLFNIDLALSDPEKVLSLLLRFKWETIQTAFGNLVAHFRNNFWRTNIEYYHGATLVNRDNPSNKGWGMTTGPYINSVNLVADPKSDATFAHEYGHTKQSKMLGPLYLPIVGFPSLIGIWTDSIHDHDREWYEVWANQLSYNYFNKNGLYKEANLLKRKYPLKQNVDWYFYVTLAYYSLLIISPFLYCL